MGVITRIRQGSNVSYLSHNTVLPSIKSFCFLILFWKREEEEKSAGCISSTSRQRPTFFHASEYWELRVHLSQV